MNIGNVFDEIQEAYTQKMIRWVPHYLELINKFSTAFPSDWAPDYILDLGSGNGNITATLIANYPYSQYTLLDASEKMLLEAKSRFGSTDFTYVKNMIQDANFTPESFSLIVASFSLHHLETKDKSSAIQSIHQWLKPGGYFGYADLFINKEDKVHNSFLQSWEQFVVKNGDREDWEYLADHYRNYDHPDNLLTQLAWLEKLNFSEITIHILDNYWIYLLAKK